MSNDNQDKSRTSGISANLVEVGVVWAKHGLSVGRSALDASAKSLHATADMLGHLANLLEGRPLEARASVGGAAAEAAAVLALPARTAKAQLSDGPPELRFRLLCSEIKRWRVA